MATTDDTRRGKNRPAIPKQTRRGRPTDDDIAAIAKARKLTDLGEDGHGLTIRQRLILETIKDLSLIHI